MRQPSRHSAFASSPAAGVAQWVDSAAVAAVCAPHRAAGRPGIRPHRAAQQRERSLDHGEVGGVRAERRRRASAPASTAAARLASWSSTTRSALQPASCAAASRSMRRPSSSTAGAPAAPKSACMAAERTLLPACAASGRRSRRPPRGGTTAVARAAIASDRVDAQPRSNFQGRGSPLAGSSSDNHPPRSAAARRSACDRSPVGAGRDELASAAAPSAGARTDTSTPCRQGDEPVHSSTRRLGSQQAGAILERGTGTAASSAADSAGESAVLLETASAPRRGRHVEARAGGTRQPPDLRKCTRAAAAARAPEPSHGGRAHERRLAPADEQAGTGRPEVPGPGRRGRLVWRGAASALTAHATASSRGAAATNSVDLWPAVLRGGL